MDDTETRVIPCWQLRISGCAMDEADFSRLVTALGALGQAEEVDAEHGLSCRLAWFPLGENARRQRAHLRDAVLRMGVDARDLHIERLDGAWDRAWQQGWKAQAIGQRLCVRPSFCEPLPDRSLDIVLDPGMAFGTGTHPTTRLCLEAIEEYCQVESPASMLDMGAGSGLLAIAAARLGVPDVWAIDNEPDAVAACRDNARANGVSLHIELADTPPDERFDLVVANILAGPLLEMAEALAHCARRALILSGLLADQRQAIRDVYEGHGLRLCHSAQARAHGDDWLALTFVRD